MPPKKVSLPPNPPPDPSQSIPLQYTTFFSVAPLNAKNVSSSYLKTEAQTWISRSQSAVQSLVLSKKRRLDAPDAPDAPDASINIDDDDDDLDAEHVQAEAAENSPAHRTIVIHPGSNNLRLGRATDLFPITLPNVIARRAKKLAPQSQARSDLTNAMRATDASTSNPSKSIDMDVEMTDEQAIPKAAAGDADAEEKPQQQRRRDDDDDDDDDEDEDEEEEEEAVALIRKNPRRSAASASEKPSASISSAVTQDASESCKSSLDQGIETIRNDLRAIMRQEKLRSVGNAKNLAANYNDSSQPEDVPEHNDLFGLEWTDQDMDGDNDVLVGEQALRLPCFSQPKTPEPKQQAQRRPQLHPTSAVKPPCSPETSRSWTLFRPFKRATLDLNAYEQHYGASAAVQALLGDVRTILEHAITSPPDSIDDRHETTKVMPVGLGIPRQEFHLCTVILIVPDLFCRSDIKSLVELLLVDMGFAQACIQQESVCATFGAGLSSGCVVDMGSEKISISCVEEGLILPETRIQLAYGGNDVTNFLAELLIRAKFPYRELDYRSSVADHMLIDELKCKLATLNPSDVGLNIHDFYLRLPARPTIKYLFRTYDELIMGPMSLFDPLVFDLDHKPRAKGKSESLFKDDDGQDEGIAEDLTELSVLHGLDVPVTGAMTSCVKHLLPPPPAPAAPSAAATASSTSHTGTDALAVTAGSEAGTPTATTDVKSKLDAGSAMPSRAASPSAVKADAAGAADTGSMFASADASARPSPTPQPSVSGAAGASQDAQPAVPSGATIDIHYEASKTALDVAILNSLLTSIGQVGPAGDERLRKMSNNILCVGGTARIPGLGAALEARLTSMLGNHFLATTGDANNAPKVTLIPPPREMDPQVLAWKGMSVFARLEAASQELCLRREDWFLFGWRALREKTLFL